MGARSSPTRRSRGASARTEHCRQCGWTLGEWVGVFFISRHEKREEICLLPITVRCPRCLTSWCNPAVPLFDDIVDVVMAALAEARRELGVKRIA